jgi:hypothetical protein
VTVIASEAKQSRPVAFPIEIAASRYALLAMTPRVSAR